MVLWNRQRNNWEVEGNLKFIQLKSWKNETFLFHSAAKICAKLTNLDDSYIVHIVFAIFLCSNFITYFCNLYITLTNIILLFLNFI